VLATRLRTCTCFGTVITKNQTAPLSAASACGRRRLVVITHGQLGKLAKGEAGPPARHAHVRGRGAQRRIKRLVPPAGAGRASGQGFQQALSAVARRPPSPCCPPLPRRPARFGAPCTSRAAEQAAACAGDPRAAHRGCMKTANALRATPAAAVPVAARTQCGVACSAPPDCTCAPAAPRWCQAPLTRLVALFLTHNWLMSSQQAAAERIGCQAASSSPSCSGPRRHRARPGSEGGSIRGGARVRRCMLARQRRARRRARACMASPSWKARCSGGRATRTTRPQRPRMYSPAAASGAAAGAPPRVYSALVRPARGAVSLRLRERVRSGVRSLACAHALCAGVPGCEPPCARGSE